MRIGTEHREDVIAHKFFAQIFDENMFFLDAEQLCLFTGGLQFFTLAKIGSEGHDFAAIGGLQPLENDGRVEAAGIGENNAFDVFNGSGHGEALVAEGKMRAGPSLIAADYRAASVSRKSDSLRSGLIRKR